MLKLVFNGYRVPVWEDKIFREWIAVMNVLNMIEHTFLNGQLLIVYFSTIKGFFATEGDDFVF